MTRRVAHLFTAAALVLSALVLVCRAHADDEALRAVRFCSAVTDAVNTLASFTKTTCVPTKGEEGKIDLFVISGEPVFSTDSSKKAWLITVAQTVGKVSRDHPSMKLGLVLATDMNLMKERVSFTFPAPLAVTLQEKVSGGKLTPEQFYSQLSAALKRTPPQQ